MRAIDTNPRKDKTDINRINHLIKTTYKFITTPPFAISAHNHPRQIPILFRLLYNDFNTFDKNSCRIDYADRSAEDDLTMRQARTLRSRQRECVHSNLLISDGRDKKEVGAKKEPPEVIFRGLSDWFRQFSIYPLWLSPRSRHDRHGITQCPSILMCGDTVPVLRHVVFQQPAEFLRSTWNGK